MQVAAFPDRAAALSLVDRLKARGVSARVAGSAQPYRVWVGRYPTRAEAATVLKDLKDRKIATDAFIVEAIDR